MRKNMKAKVAALLASLSLFAVGLGISLWQFDKTIVEASDSHSSTLGGFIIDEAASIRTKDPLGIRFKVHLGADAQAIYSELDNATCGTIMLPEDMLTGELTFDTQAILDVPTKIWKEENAVYQSVLGGSADDNGEIMDIPESYYNRPIVARGYIKGTKTVDGEQESYTYYTENISTRSIGYVATMEKLSGAATTELIETIVSQSIVEIPQSITMSVVGDSAMLRNTAAKNYAYGLTIAGIQANVFGLSNVTEFSYVSNNPTVVDVEEGKLVAKQVGSTSVTASVTIGGTSYSGTINVTVNEDVNFASKYTILVPAGTMSAHYAAPVKYAATELKRLFEEATGATIGIREESGNEKTDGKYIALGNTVLGNSVTLSESKTTASVVKTVGNTIVIKGVTDEGTMYGTYEWLTSLLGYEYFAKDTYALTKNSVELVSSTKADWDATYTPDIEYSISPSEDISTNDNLLNRYRMNNWYSDIMVVNGGRIHNVFNVLPPYNTESTSTAGNVTDHEKWYSHEWELSSLGYAIDGVEDQYGRTVPYELCYQAGGDTNEYNAMVSAAVEAYKTAFELPENAGLTKASLSIRDDEVWCQCSACYNTLTSSYKVTPTDAALGFVNDVCAGIREWLTAQNDPRKDTFRMIFLAYHMTGAAPTSVTTLDPYIDVWFAESNAVYTLPMNEATDTQTQTTYANLQAWATLLKETQNCTNGVRNNNLLVWTYNSNMYELLAPYDSFDSMRVNYGLFKGLNVDSVYNYTDAAMSGWAGLKKYLASQLAWNANPTDDQWNAWIDNFFTNAYGAGATQMKAWFENYLVYEDTIVSKFNVERSIYQDVATSEFFTKDILNTWLSYADAALNALDKNDSNYQTYYNNIALERLSPIYLMLEIYGEELDEQTKIGYVATFCGEAKSLGIQKTGHTVAIDETLAGYDALLKVEKDVAVGVGETLASSSVFDNGEEVVSVKVNGVESYNNGEISLASTGAYKAIVTGSNGTMKIVMLHYADKVIRTVSDLSAVKYTVVGGQNESGSISGYYVLGNDIDAAGATISGAGYGWSQNTGFKGVFDGREYTISNLTVNGNGIFGTLGGATVQNVNFAGVTLGQNSALFASMSYKSTVQNVNVTYAGINAEVTSYAGLLIARQSNNQNKWIDVTLNADKLTVPVALGYNTNNNTYEDVTIKAAAVTVIGYTDGGNTAITEWPTGINFEKVAVAQEVTVSDEVIAEIGGTVNGLALTVEKTKFAHSSLTAGEEVRMTVNGAAVSATAYDGYVLADLNGVSVTAGTVTTATIMTADYTIIYDNVFAVTMIINTFDELSVVKYTGDKSATGANAYAINGYYVLGGNIDGGNATFSGAVAAWNAGIGFCGTLDGRDYTISNFNTGDYGLFGNTSNATVKNLKLSVNSAAANVLTGNYRGGTIENVEITVSAMSSTWGGILAGEISAVQGENALVKDVQINTGEVETKGTHILCNTYPGATFENVQITTHRANGEKITSTGTPDSGVTVTLVGKTEVTIETEVLAETVGAKFEHSAFTAGETVTATINGKSVTATAYDGYVTVGDCSGAGLTAGTVTTAVITTESYAITYANVFYVTQIIDTFDELSAVKYTGTRITGYYVLGGNISCNWATISGASYGWGTGVGFGGTFDGRGYTIDRFNVSGYGMFGTLGSGTVKNVNFDMVTLNSGAALLARTMSGGTIENVTLKLNDYKATSGECGIFVSRQTNSKSVYRNVTVNANGLDIYNVLGREYDANTTTVENFVINNAGTVTLYGTSDSAGATAIDKPAGLTINYAVVKVEESITAALAADNATGLIVNNANIKSGDSITATVNESTVTATATADGTVTVDVSSLNLTAGTIYTVVLDSTNYTLTCEDVMFADTVIRTFAELSAIKYTGTRITGYYVLGGNISCNWATISGASYGWGTGVGFGGTFDGRGYTIDRFNVSGYGMFGTLGSGTVKNVNFDMVTLNSGAALLARTMSGGTIENVTLKLNDYKATSGECGIFVSRQTNSKSVYRNVTVNANGLDIYNVLGREYDANTTTVENFVINNAGTVTLYGTSDSAGATAIDKPAGLTINYAVVKVEESITAALAADNATGLIVNNANIKSGDSITATVNESTVTATATADGTVTVDVSSLNLTAGTIYTVVLDSTNYALTCTDVTFADKAIRTKGDLASVRYNGTNITGYFVLANDITDYGAVTMLAPSMNWSADQGFMGTFDGNGYKISGMNFTNVKNGFFVKIGQGAYLKDFTFDEVIAESGYQRSILAQFCFGGSSGGTVIENVTIRFKQLKATATSQQDASSMLIGRSMNNTNLINVTLDASGLDIPAWLYVLSQEVQNSCKFTNCTVKANSFVEITRGNTTNWYGVVFQDTDA